jgi:hypothetical protein
MRTALTAMSSWWLSRKISTSDRGKVVPFVLISHAIPSLVVLLPDAAMGFAVAHVRASTDENAPHSEIVKFLAQTGSFALTAGRAAVVRCPQEEDGECCDPEEHGLEGNDE